MFYQGREFGDAGDPEGREIAVLALHPFGEQLRGSSGSPSRNVVAPSGLSEFAMAHLLAAPCATQSSLRHPRGNSTLNV